MFANAFNAHMRKIAWCARVYARIFTKLLLVVLYYLMNISFKFHKDQSFCCGDIAKLSPSPSWGLR